MGVYSAAARHSRSFRFHLYARAERRFEARELLVRDRVGVLLLREGAVAYIRDVFAECGADLLGELGVALDETRRASLVHAEQVVPDEYLAVGASARAD